MDRQTSRVTLLDGGLATELQARGWALDTVLWSAEYLRSNPRALIDAHCAYLEAGTDVLTSASYQASRAGFHQFGVAAAEADRLIVSSVALARAACDEFAAANPDASPRKVAASVGPYGAVLNDGSEYSGEYGVPALTLRQFHAQRLNLLDRSGADFLAVETLPSLLEARVLSDLLAACATPAWVSFSCRDEQHICDGSGIEEAAALFSAHPRVFAIGVNCTAPQYVAELVSRIRLAAPDKVVIAYPNSGEIYDAQQQAWRGTASPVDFLSAAKTWVAAGATWVGGCCRTGPAHISTLRKGLRQARLRATPPQ